MALRKVTGLRFGDVYTLVMWSEAEPLRIDVYQRRTGRGTAAKDTQTTYLPSGSLSLPLPHAYSLSSPHDVIDIPLLYRRQLLLSTLPAENF